MTNEALKFKQEFEKNIAGGSDKAEYYAACKEYCEIKDNKNKYSEDDYWEKLCKAYKKVRITQNKYYKIRS
jgi:hypothetical protein